ncbi:thiamine-phosphate kinase [Arcobacter sp. F2176]|uniref:thiamine-phosphate kinase n=1 Tax=Arcobacter sp. F2176 TaxID=2044511 RepID=UPI00100C18F7|nr:thiamine-phosphate kinase [Arcobacter sp. F2176]RXJ79021.1 thiamine-phosphate kinase [Arcobacter sp. F2176]
MNKEDFFIKQFKNTHKNIIGDDGAVVGSHVYSMDAFFENVHFKREWMSLKDIARKAMIVNISDAIVMNAIPKYALISIAIPKDFSKDDLKELANGFKNIAKKFGIKIIGGDTISNVKLDISITIISKTKKPIFRKGLKKGDLVCFTGELGTCKKDLESLLQGKEVSKKSKFIKPKLKSEFFYEISPYINCALDISDGLFFELERLSETNNLGFDFFDKISKDIGCSGEEYEILFSFCAKNRDIISKIAKKHKVKLNIFAKVVDGTYKGDCQNHHFN